MKFHQQTGERISVLITTCNRAGMVCEAIDSVLAQTRPPDEIIVVDDGSTDDTADRIAACFPEVRYICTAHRGVSNARNTAILEANGDLVAFLDSDDLWARRKLEIQVAAMDKNPGFLISHTNEIWLRNGKRINQKLKHRKESGWIFEASLHLCLVSPSSTIIRRRLFDSIGFFDESLAVCEDYDFWLRTAHRFPFLFVEHPLLVKRGGHTDQLSRRFWGMDRFRIEVLLKLLWLPDLSGTERQWILKVLDKKTKILRRGHRIRGKTCRDQWTENLLQAGQRELLVR